MLCYERDNKHADRLWGYQTLRRLGCCLNKWTTCCCQLRGYDMIQSENMFAKGTNVSQLHNLLTLMLIHLHIRLRFHDCRSACVLQRQIGLPARNIQYPPYWENPRRWIKIVFVWSFNRPATDCSLHRRLVCPFLHCTALTSPGFLTLAQSEMKPFFLFLFLF